MAKCKHENSIALETIDVVNRPEVEALYEHGNLSQLQQLTETPTIVSVTTRFCPACGRIYGEITSAA